MGKAPMAPRTCAGRSTGDKTVLAYPMAPPHSSAERAQDEPLAGEDVLEILARALQCTEGGGAAEAQNMLQNVWETNEAERALLERLGRVSSQLISRCTQVIAPG